MLAMETEGDRRPTVRTLELLRKAAESHVKYVRDASEVCMSWHACMACNLKSDHRPGFPIV